jgi:universal stress protein A
MLPFKKILCPTDFSEPSYEALRMADELTLLFSAELFVVHVIAPIPIAPVPSALMIGGSAPENFDILSYKQDLQTKAENKLKEIIDLKLSKKISVHSRVLYGNAAEEIVSISEKDGVDLIVIASHGETGWRRFVFGSVVEKVVRLASCPVLTIRAKQE